jgi:hypothetical protein
MEFILNEELVPMINNGMLNMEKILCLIEIKEFVDRVASKNYLDEHIVNKIEEKYGVKPSVITWGDYFQTETAYDLQWKTEEDYQYAVETIKFDILSSQEIFTDKGRFLFDWVEQNYNSVESDFSNENVTEQEYKEALHLKILKDYYSNMKIKDNFTTAEKLWYNEFKEKKVG